jgi:hypothetical protein
MNDNTGLIYLAQPYSHPDERVRALRTELGFVMTARLMNSGYTVFSPIVHTHLLESRLRRELAEDHDFWMKQDIAILRHCAELVVLTLPGWEESKGVAEEIAVAQACGIPITYMEAV